MKSAWTLASVAGLSMLVLVPWSMAQRPSKAEREVRELEGKVNAAYEANDLPTYFSFYAPDLSQWFPEGRTDLPTYRKQWTSFIQNGGRIEGLKISDLHIQVGPGGDTAVASYLIEVRTRSEKGQLTEEVNQETDVLFKRGNVWKIVFLHYSPAAKGTQ
jgi:ketosteroid isomerase-like protein